jgi:phosphoribosylanthranilate isomerase
VIKLIIKICGVKNLKELEIVERYADATGVIVKCNSRRCVSLKTAREIIQNATIPVFAVSTSSNLDVWMEIISGTDCDFVQLHSDSINAEIMDHLKEHVKVMKAFMVRDGETKAEASRIIGQIENFKPHFILLDSGCGSGKVHNWEVSKIISEKFSVFLAGGLKLENVVEAVETVNPAGLDVSSGVEVDGYKDENLVRGFVSRVRGIDVCQEDKK